MPSSSFTSSLRIWTTISLVSLAGLFGCSEDGGSDGPGTGGAVGTGGTGTGGVGTGGANTGGFATGGASTGGVSTGGTTTGGASTGGTSTGGSDTGGASTGGTGGAETGGADTGGTGGDATGGSGSEFCPSDEPCKVLPLGDSITEDVTQPGGAWRIEFFRRAMMDGKDITFVGSRSNGPDMVDGNPFPKSHEGTSGITIGNLNNKIPSPGLDNPPHIILLHIGTNDMLSNAAGAPAALEALVTDLITEAPDALLVVSSIIPFNNVEAYNATIEPLVEAKAAEGAHIMFADQYSAFPNGQLADGVHPTPAGYDVMGGVYYDLVKDYLP